LPSGQPEQTTIEATAPDSSASDAAALAAQRQREAQARAKAAEQRANALAKSQDNAATANPGIDAAKKPEAPKPAPKMVSVQVTYDEAGRVTSTSGGDSNALRIARQKRFPAGKAGSTTVTIPIN
jgi:type II secretory pathway pseudopilin PulG